jgi:4-hydroxyphenylpyruvate dioxygenase
VFNDYFRSAPSRMIARDGLRSLILSEANATGQGLPAIPEVDGFEFLEFAVDAATGEALGLLLRQLGFHLAGRHRTKDVVLYRQGGVNFVLNSEQDSAASEHFQLHGPSVCAMALRVDDPARAVERARALLIPDWRERIGAGEAPIPAVRGPEGTLIYLVARGLDFWAIDFELLPETATGAGLLGIDHLALALPAWQMDTYVLFWRSLFGLAPQAVFDLPDPFGLIQSRAMVNASGSLRLTLNISEAQDTVTNRFVSAFAGAGVHHIALGTADALGSAQRLREAGAPLLLIPPNYYEDIGARFPLDDAALGPMEKLGILYDAAGEGEFLHAYTETFQSRFFFEIVERRSGYAGFGAANAAVRMAAQARRRVPTW